MTTTASTSVVEGIARDAAARVWFGARLPLESVIDETQRVARAVLETRDPAAVWEAVYALLMALRAMALVKRNHEDSAEAGEPGEGVTCSGETPVDVPSAPLDRGFGNYL